MELLTSGPFLFTTFYLAVIICLGLPYHASGATHSLANTRAFAARGRQSLESGTERRGRRSTTTTTARPTTTTATTTTTTSNSAEITLTSADSIAMSAALVAPQNEHWSGSTDSTSNYPVSFTYSSLLSTRSAPIEIVVKPHSKVVLPCELDTNLTNLLLASSRSYRTRPASWLHEKVHVDMITIDTRVEISGTGHRYIGDSTTSALHIDNVMLEDNGTWDCSIENGDGKSLFGRPVQLIVLDAPRGTYLLIDGMRLDPGNQFVPVKEGSELTLQCAVEGGNPAPALTWGMTLSQATLEGPEQSPDNLTILPSADDKPSSAHLKVLRGHHNATISCIAKHITLATPMNASILLDVQYTPSFAIMRLPGFGIPIVEGMSVSLKCEVDSNPASMPIWQRDNGPPPVEQSEDGWLNFTKISQTHSGWYKCYTRHSLGVFTSIGYFLNVRNDPGIEIETEELNGDNQDSRKMEVQIGGAVTLECDGGCWGHGPELNPAGGPGSLMLSRVVYQDAGTYRCVAPDKKEQDTWKAQLPYEIHVTGPPMIHPPIHAVTANEGDSLDVTMEFCAEPAYSRLMWIANDRVFVPDRSISLDGVQVLPIQNTESSTCYKTVLHFEAVKTSHEGEWLLLVRSTKGFADATVVLNVTRAYSYSYANCRSFSPVIPVMCFIVNILLQYRYTQLM